MTDTTRTELASACPFCGNADIDMSIPKSDEEEPFGECMECGALGPDAPTMAEALVAWNKRASILAPAVECELLTAGDIVLALQDAGLRIVERNGYESFSNGAKCILDVVRAKCRPVDVAELRKRVDQLDVQLAGCGVAALGWSKGENRAKQGDYGWSASYQDVVVLRERYESAEATIARQQDRLDEHARLFETHAECDAARKLDGAAFDEELRRQREELRVAREKLEQAERERDEARAGLGLELDDRKKHLTAIATLAREVDRLQLANLSDGLSEALKQRDANAQAARELARLREIRVIMNRRDLTGEELGEWLHLLAGRPSDKGKERAK